jgi:hypothetical protein
MIERISRRATLGTVAGIVAAAVVPLPAAQAAPVAFVWLVSRTEPGADAITEGACADPDSAFTLVAELGGPGDRSAWEQTSGPDVTHPNDDPMWRRVCPATGDTWFVEAWPLRGPAPVTA